MNRVLAPAIAVLLTVSYAAYFFTFQFFQTGSDIYGECPGLESAANESSDVPMSLSDRGPFSRPLRDREIWDVSVAV
jgi:hypothetical protein